MNKVEEIQKLLEEIEELAANFPDFKVDEKIEYDEYVKSFYDKIDVLSVEIKKMTPDKGISLGHTNLSSRLE